MLREQHNMQWYDNIGCDFLKRSIQMDEGNVLKSFIKYSHPLTVNQIITVILQYFDIGWGCFFNISIV